MTLPALATVYEHFCRADRSETSLSQKLSRYGVLWLLGVAYVMFRIHFLGALAPEEKFRQVTLQQIVLSAIALVAQYVWKLLWPVRLCAFYVFHPSTSLFDLRVLAGLLALLAFAALFFVCWRSRERNVRLVFFAILWFFATLAPILNAHWVGENVFTERYLYLPSVGVAWLVGLGASKLWSRAAPRPAERWALVLAGFALGGLCAARIVTRNRDWNNDKVLFTRTLDLSPGAYQVLNALGGVYWREGDLDKAESAWRGVLARKPDNPEAFNNLGLLASQRHQYAEAKGFFQRAMELKPNLADPHFNLGDTYLKMGLRARLNSNFERQSRFHRSTPALIISSVSFSLRRDAQTRPRSSSAPPSVIRRMPSPTTFSVCLAFAGGLWERRRVTFGPPSAWRSLTATLTSDLAIFTRLRAATPRL